MPRHAHVSTNMCTCLPGLTPLHTHTEDTSKKSLQKAYVSALERRKPPAPSRVWKSSPAHSAWENLFYTKLLSFRYDTRVSYPTYHHLCLHTVPHLPYWSKYSCNHWKLQYPKSPEICSSSFPLLVNKSLNVQKKIICSSEQCTSFPFFTTRIAWNVIFLLWKPCGIIWYHSKLIYSKLKQQ